MRHFSHIRELRLVIAGACLSLLLTSVAAAQSAPAPAAQSADDRIKALEDRIIALEGQVRMLKEQQSAAGPAAAPGTAAAGAPAAGAATTAQAAPPEPAPPAATVATTESAATPANLPVYGGSSAAAKALNPDISVIGDFLATGGHSRSFGVLGAGEGSGFFSPSPAFEMHESEVGLQAIIDPYARGDFFISFGQEGVDLEEGYITFTALPAGLVLRGGKMRAAFGKVNTLHNHVLPWTDRPLVTESLVGGEDGINDAGLSLTRNFAGPKNLFLEATAQIFRGESDNIFTSSRRGDVSVAGHLRGYKDISESTNLDLGVSYARGHNDLGSAFLTNLYGLDATLRWKPLRRSIYHSFIGRGEFIWSDREGVARALATPTLPATRRAFGFYTSGDYQFARRWFIGGRYDQSGRPRADLLDRGGSIVLTYWPSEFAQVRTQYRLTRYAEGISANELRLQLQFSLGAHGAHPF
jgi:hypothetical protein